LIDVETQLEIELILIIHPEVEVGLILELIGKHLNLIKIVDNRYRRPKFDKIPFTLLGNFTIFEVN
jgi:hypothetical protein